MKVASKLVSLSLLLALFTSTALGQDRNDEVWKESMQDLSMVMYAGLGGMVLGLSTLPFYSRPSKHMRNVVVGGSLGVAAGVAVVVYTQAIKSRSVLPSAGVDDAPSAYFNSRDREKWHAVDAPKVTAPLLVAHQFSF